MAQFLTVASTNAYSAMLFVSNGHQLVVMPLMAPEASGQARAGREATAEAEKPAEPTEPGEAEKDRATGLV